MTDTNAGPVLPERPSIRGFGSWDFDYLQNKFDAYGRQCWNACDEQVAGPLREALSECATAVGAGVSPDCSVDFLREVPREVELVVAKLRERVAELENQLGITRMCVVCGKSKPASEPREAPGCPPVDPEYGHLCGFDMTPQEAWLHWRQIAHDQRNELDRLRAECEALSDSLRECADDLESEVKARASGDLPRRIERDLDPVRRARELLAASAARGEG
jgi:hypothetical protein